MQPLGDELLAGAAVLTRDQHVGVRGPHALHRAGESASSLATSAIICGRWSRRSNRFSVLEANGARRNARPSSICVVENGDEPRVVPTAFRCSRVRRAASLPLRCRCEPHAVITNRRRHVRLERLESVSSRSRPSCRTSCRGCSSCRAASRRSRDARASAQVALAGRVDGVDVEAMAFEQKAKGLQHVVLVVGDEDVRCCRRPESMSSER